MQDSFIHKLKNYTVLYIEDEDGIRKNINEILKTLFKESFEANNATKGYELYLKHKPDLIITDIKMSGQTGLDLINKIRKNDLTTRIIITSAHTDLDYLLEATQLHLLKYIVKPISQDKLTEALNLFIKSYDFNKIYYLNDDWMFDYNKSLIKNSKEEFILTKKENSFLKLLLTKDRIISYEELESKIWDQNSVMTANAMRLFVKNFRKKLPKDFLKNIQGMGYIINKEKD